MNDEIRARYAVAGKHVWEFLDEYPDSAKFLIQVAECIKRAFSDAGDGTMTMTLQVIGETPTRVYVGVRSAMPWHEAMACRASADSSIKMRAHLHPNAHAVWVSVTVTKEGSDAEVSG